VAQDTPDHQETKDPDEHTHTAEAGAQDKLAQLRLRRSKLTPEEAALLRAYFPTLRAKYRKLVLGILRRERKPIPAHDIEELLQDIFFTFHRPYAILVSPRISAPFHRNSASERAPARTATRATRLNRSPRSGILAVVPPPTRWIALS
jgi:hypothetical protein